MQTFFNKVASLESTYLFNFFKNNSVQFEYMEKAVEVICTNSWPKTDAILRKHSTFSNYSLSFFFAYFHEILRRYNTIKTCWWNFPKLFIIGKYVKIMFKNRGSPCYFLSSRGQKIKNIAKTEQRKLFLLRFLLSFFMVFLVQILIYARNM